MEKYKWNKQDRLLTDFQAFKYLYPTNITKRAGKVVIVQGLLVFTKTIESYAEEISNYNNDDLFENDNENEDDEGIYEIIKYLPSKEIFLENCSIAFIKSLGVTTVQRILEIITMQHYNLRLSYKLIKDIQKSSIRKHIRTMNRTATAKMLLKTGARSNIIPQIAFFIVEEIHCLIVLTIKKIKRNKRKKQIVNGEIEIAVKSDKKKDNLMDIDCENDGALFLRITKENMKRCGLSFVFTVLGGSIGTFIKPGKGTVIGAAIGDQLAFMI